MPKRLRYDESKVRPEQLYDMILLIEDGTITHTTAKVVFAEMFATGKDPRQIVEDQGLYALTDHPL